VQDGACSRRGDLLVLITGYQSPLTIGTPTRKTEAAVGSYRFRQESFRVESAYVRHTKRPEISRNELLWLADSQPIVLSGSRRLRAEIPHTIAQWVVR